jgi:hypothetical protein
MGGSAMIPPQLLQQLAQMMKNQQGAGAPQGGGPPGAAPPMPAMPPPGMPGAQGAPDASGSGGQMPQVGPGNQQMGSGKASPVIPGVPVSNQPAKQQGNIRVQGIASLPFAAMAIKKKMTDDKVNKYRTLANEWVAKKMDPTADKADQKRASENPEIAKALAKKDKEFVKMVDEAMKDPSSPAAQGIQAAYRDQQKQDQKEQLDQQMQERMRQMQTLELQRQAVAQREQAQAGKVDKETDQMGSVTDKDKFQAQQKLQLQANDISGKFKRLGLQTGTMITIAQNRIASAKDQTHERVEGSKEVARIGAKGKTDSASIAAAARRQQTTDYIVKRYDAVNKRLIELDKRGKEIQDHIDKNTHLGGMWTPDDLAESQKQLEEIAAQQGILQGEFQGLQSQDQFFQSKGWIAPVDMTGGDGLPTPATSGATDHPAGPPKPSAGNKPTIVKMW